MLDLTKDILIPITAPSLTTEEYGKHIEEVFDNIWKNFQTIINLDYLKGSQGDSIITKTAKLNDISDIDVTKSWGQIIEDVIRFEYDSDLLRSISDGKITITPFSYLYNELGDFNPNIQLTLIYKKDNNTEEEILVSSLPFIYLDQRFNHKIISLVDSTQYDGIEDCTCILNIENGEFKLLKTYPTLYYDKNNGNFCWKINSTETGLLARGPMGIEGRSAKCHVIKCKDTITNNSIIYNKLYIFDKDLNTEDKWTPINKNSASKYDIQPGDLSFILVEKNPGDVTSNYDFYISNILYDENANEDKQYYTIISDNSIYTQFLTKNFKSFLSNINIFAQDEDSLKGLYIPICPGNPDKVDFVHMICATPTSTDLGASSEITSENINFNIIPTTNLNNVNSETVQVQRAAKIYNINDTYDEKNLITINYKLKHNQYDSLKQQLGLNDEDMCELLMFLYGEYEKNIDYIKNLVSSSSPVYTWIDNDDKYYISNSLNLYNNSDIEICRLDQLSKNIYSYKVFENESYILNTTLLNNEDYEDSVSLNFGYNNVYFGSKSSVDSEADVNVNINGNLHSSSLYSNNININNANIDRLNSSEVSSSHIVSEAIESIDLKTNNIEAFKITGGYNEDKEIPVNNIYVNDIESTSIKSDVINTKNDDGTGTITTDTISSTNNYTDHIIATDGKISAGNLYNFFAGPDVEDENQTPSTDDTIKVKKGVGPTRYEKTGEWYASINDHNIRKDTIIFSIKASDYGSNVKSLKFTGEYPIYAIYSSYKYRRTRATGDKPWFYQYTGRLQMYIEYYKNKQDNSYQYKTFYTIPQFKHTTYWGDKDVEYTNVLASVFSSEDINTIQSIFRDYFIKQVSVKVVGQTEKTAGFEKPYELDRYGAGFEASGVKSTDGCGDRRLIIGIRNPDFKITNLTNDSTASSVVHTYRQELAVEYDNPKYTAGNTAGYPKLFLNNSKFIIKFGSADNAKIVFELKDEKPRIVIGKYIFTGETYNNGTT